MDFLVGDTPELALATGAIVGLAFLLAGQRVVGAILLPLVAAAFLFVSTYRGRRGRRVRSGSLGPPEAAGGSGIMGGRPTDGDSPTGWRRCRGGTRMSTETRGVVATAKGAPVTVETILVPDPARVRRSSA